MILILTAAALLYVFLMGWFLGENVTKQGIQRSVDLIARSQMLICQAQAEMAKSVALSRLMVMDEVLRELDPVYGPELDQYLPIVKMRQMVLEGLAPEEY